MCAARQRGRDPFILKESGGIEVIRRAVSYREKAVNVNEKKEMLLKSCRVGRNKQVVQHCFRFVLASSMELNQVCALVTRSPATIT